MPKASEMKTHERLVGGLLLRVFNPADACRCFMGTGLG